jgi:hypothetical protein
MRSERQGGRHLAWARPGAVPCMLLAAGFAWPGLALAHNVAAGDRAFLAASTGPQPAVYFYLGAKHMITGYDHLMFLFGVIFFLYRLKQVAGYVTLFALGHSTTLLAGVLLGWHVNAWVVDAIIGLSVVYKGFENLGGFRSLGWEPDPRAAVGVFGLFHGLGLATKIQELSLARESLVPNMISFNLGVECGQLLALGFMLIIVNALRASGHFERRAFAANMLLVLGGFLLMGYQLSGYFTSATVVAP